VYERQQIANTRLPSEFQQEESPTIKAFAFDTRAIKDGFENVGEKK
jgi:hypothetical protein